MLVTIVKLIILFYTLSLFGCTPKTEIIDRYDNGRIKLTRDYKVTNGCVAVNENDFLILAKLINKKTNLFIIQK